jgi:hypothetical protein
MTTPIGAIGSVGALAGVSPLGAALPTPSIDQLNGASAAGGEDFAAKLAEGLQNLTDLQTKSDDLSV